MRPYFLGGEYSLSWHQFFVGLQMLLGCFWSSVIVQPITFFSVRIPYLSMILWNQTGGVLDLTTSVIICIALLGIKPRFYSFLSVFMHIFSSLPFFL